MKTIKKHISTVLIFAVLLAGVGMLLYPTVSEKLNALNQSRAISGYSQAVESLELEDYEPMLLAAERYNEELLKKEDRFRPTDEELSIYNELLNPVGNGIMAYVTIPKIDVRLPVYHGTDESVLQTAIGHIPGSSLPVGGMNTHSVVSGHRGLPSAKLFTRLDELSEGDGFILTALNRELYYRVDQIKVVLPSEIENIQIVDGKDYCTLITCTPYGINSHRMLVRGHRVDSIDAIIKGANAEQGVDSAVAPAQAGREIPNWIPMAFAAFGIIVIGGAFFVPVKRRDKK